MSDVKHFLKFSHEYPKLDHPLFTTIRRYDKYPAAGALMGIVTPTRRFSAFLVLKIKHKIGKLDTTFLTLDTGTHTRAAAFKVLDSFYKKRIHDEEIFTILFLRTHRTGLEKIKVNDQWLGADQARIDCITCRGDLDHIFDPDHVPKICESCLALKNVGSI